LILGVPRWLTAVVRKGLAENPDERYLDMPELLRALKGGPPDDETATDEPGDDDHDDDSVEHEGRVLHAPATPAGAAPQRERWPPGADDRSPRQPTPREGRAGGEGPATGPPGAVMTMIGHRDNQRP
jgi:hypothetical protein